MHQHAEHAMNSLTQKQSQVTRLETELQLLGNCDIRILLWTFALIMSSSTAYYLFCLAGNNSYMGRKPPPHPAFVSNPPLTPSTASMMVEDPMIPTSIEVTATTPVAQVPQETQRFSLAHSQYPTPSEVAVKQTPSAMLPVAHGSGTNESNTITDSLSLKAEINALQARIMEKLQGPITS